MFVYIRRLMQCLHYAALLNYNPSPHTNRISRHQSIDARPESDKRRPPQDAYDRVLLGHATNRLMADQSRAPDGLRIMRAMHQLSSNPDAIDVGPSTHFLPRLEVRRSPPYADAGDVRIVGVANDERPSPIRRNISYYDNVNSGEANDLANDADHSLNMNERRLMEEHRQQQPRRYIAKSADDRLPSFVTASPSKVQQRYQQQASHLPPMAAAGRHYGDSVVTHGQDNVTRVRISPKVG